MLLVEDEEIVRRLTGFVLQASGYTILSASSGEEALELCREHPGEISLMVTDILMPQMDGVRLAGESFSMILITGLHRKQVIYLSLSLLRPSVVSPRELEPKL